MANLGCATCMHSYDGKAGHCSITNTSIIDLKEACDKQLPILDTAFRYKELLDAIIDNLHVGEKNETVIKYLLHIGFTEEELIEHFHYPEEEVKDASEEMDDYHGALLLV